VWGGGAVRSGGGGTGGCCGGPAARKGVEKLGTVGGVLEGTVKWWRWGGGERVGALVGKRRETVTCGLRRVIPKR